MKNTYRYNIFLKGKIEQRLAREDFCKKKYVWYENEQTILENILRKFLLLPTTSPLLVYCRSINIFLAIFLLQAILDFLQDGGFPQRPSALEKDDHLDQRWEKIKQNLDFSIDASNLCLYDVLTELFLCCTYVRRCQILGGASNRAREDTKSVLKSLGRNGIR